MPPPDTPKKTIQSSYINLAFPTMIRKARWAADACGPMRWRGLDAVVYSAFAIEAFANDFVTMGTLLELERAPKPIRHAVKSLQRKEARRWSTMEKITALYERLSDLDAPKGSEPLQSVSLLFDLRDGIVHAKADIIEGQSTHIRSEPIERLLSRIRQRGDLVPRNLRLLEDWRLMLDLSPGVANWALDTARGVAIWIRDACPDSKLKRDWLTRTTGARSAMYSDH